MIEQTSTPNNLEASPERESRKEDILYLQNQIEKIHKDPYRNIDKETFQESLNNSLTVSEEFFPIAIQESLALMKDAHTKVDNLVNDWFPIQLKYLSDGNCYVIGSSSENDTIVGGKLLSINKFPLEEVCKKISLLSSKENSEQLLKDLSFFFICNTILKYYGFSSSSRETFSTDKGDFTYKETRKIHPKVRSPFEWESKDYIGNKDYKFKMDGNVLKFQYNNCTQGKSSNKELRDFKDKLVKSAKTAKNIIIDLRQNSGGNTEIMRDALDQFPKTTPIYVATSRKTFSSAMHHLIDLKEMQGAIQIGENAGQKPNRFGQGEDITLPNSKIKIKCSSKDFILMPGSDLEVLEPDIPLPLTIDDYTNERDPLEDWIKQNLK